MYKPRAYQVPEEPRDLVHLYLLYKSKRPAEMLHPDSPFFLAIMTKNPTVDEPWYKRQAIGINKMYGVMKAMLKAAGVQPNNRLTPYR